MHETNVQSADTKSDYAQLMESLAGEMARLEAAATPGPWAGNGDKP